MTRLDAIARRVEAATEGPWHVRETLYRGFTSHCVCRDTAEQDRLSPSKVARWGRNLCSGLSGNDAEFIANAQADILWLLDQLRRAKET